MKNELKELLQADLYRYSGKIEYFKPLELKWLIAWRKAGYYKRKSISGMYWYLKYRRLSQKTMIQIPTRTRVGKGFYIGHCGPVIINPDAVLGNNVNIATGVTIGTTNRGEKKGTPKIGNSVWIGTNAVIVGNITIGDDVLIAPNAFVNFDVPAHSIVVGNPGVIHGAEHATKNYINNEV